jgi:hypothetical protein
MVHTMKPYRPYCRFAIALVLGSTVSACSDGLEPEATSTTSEATSPATSPSNLLSTTDGVAIYPGSSIQSAVNSRPAGTKFIIKAGTHRRQRVVPKDGNKFVGEPGAILDGENVAYYAFETLTSKPRDVVIQGLIIQNYATYTESHAVIQGDNAINWIVEANEIRNNKRTAIRAGDGMKILRNKIHHNGMSGLGGYRADNVLIDGNEISYNNTTNATYTPSLSRIAGMKFLQGTNLTVRNNYVHHNQSKGIWTDHMYPTTLIEGNRVSYNKDCGIWHEAGYAAIIRNNITEYNGAAGSGYLANSGIQMSNSPNVQIYGNTVSYNGNGIGIMYSAGYSTTGPYGTLIVQNLSVHDNVVRMTKGRTGLVTTTTDMTIYTSRNNKFTNNTYYLGTNSQYFTWKKVNMTESQWKAIPQDATGKFYR